LLSRSQSGPFQLKLKNKAIYVTLTRKKTFITAPSKEKLKRKKSYLTKKGQPQGGFKENSGNKK
jgi:hypothetical protein